MDVNGIVLQETKSYCKMCFLQIKYFVQGYKERSESIAPIYVFLHPDKVSKWNKA